MQEYDANIIITAPTVPYKVEYRDGSHKLIRNPTEFPDSDELSWKVRSVQEPMVRSTIIFPKDYLGDIMVLCGVSFIDKYHFRICYGHLLITHIVSISFVIVTTRSAAGAYISGREPRAAEIQTSTGRSSN